MGPVGEWRWWQWVAAGAGLVVAGGAEGRGRQAGGGRKSGQWGLGAAGAGQGAAVGRPGAG